MSTPFFESSRKIFSGYSFRSARQESPRPLLRTLTFWDMEEGEKYRYIQELLHLEYYSKRSGEALSDGRRFWVQAVCINCGRPSGKHRNNYYRVKSKTVWNVICPGCESSLYGMDWDVPWEVSAERTPF